MNSYKSYVKYKGLHSYQCLVGGRIICTFMNKSDKRQTRREYTSNQVSEDMIRKFINGASSGDAFPNLSHTETERFDIGMSVDDFSRSMTGVGL